MGDVLACLAPILLFHAWPLLLLSPEYRIDAWGVEELFAMNLKVLSRLMRTFSYLHSFQRSLTGMPSLRSSRTESAKLSTSDFFVSGCIDRFGSTLRGRSLLRRRVILN